MTVFPAPATSRAPRTFSNADVAQFRELSSQTTVLSEYPLASSVLSNVLIYSAETLRTAARGPPDARDAAMAELQRCLHDGPGVFAVSHAYSASVVDRASAAFAAIIAAEKASSTGRGDHFAPAGKNERIWNSFQKHAAHDPESFVEYYANDVLALACEAWLGPGWQMTAQTNVVKPGGRAQEPHRDYHLGFQDPVTAARFPLAAQVASQLLTLQGAVAHTDMPVTSGPTQLLPFSQRFAHGYEAYRVPEFAAVFRALRVQVPLSKGDALFFNPALFHAAGDNDTSVDRVANLLQVSACWGKAMESVDRRWVASEVWPCIQWFVKNKQEQGGAHKAQVDALLAAVCDGYSFPTNLDRDPPPPSGHCPPTQLDVARLALDRGATQAEVTALLDEQAAKRCP